LLIELGLSLKAGGADSNSCVYPFHPLEHATEENSGRHLGRRVFARLILSSDSVLFGAP
jgi:hypothetical protein